MDRINKFNSVIFDLDGTLIDSMHVWEQVDIDFLGKRGLQVPDDLFKDMPAGDGYVAIAKYFKDKFALSETVEQITDEWDSMVYDFYKNIELRSGALDLIEKLHRSGIVLGIGTSNSTKLTSVVLANHKLYSFFKEVTTGSEVDRGKPFPDIYLKVSSKLNTNPEDTLVIEDTLHGVEAAKNAGMTAIAIYNDYSKKDELKLKELADYFVYNYEELDSLLFAEK